MISQGKSGRQPAALLSWVSASLKRVCTSTYDAETLSLLRATDESIAIALLFTELTSGRLPSLTEQVLLRGFGHKECVCTAFDNLDRRVLGRRVSSEQHLHFDDSDPQQAETRGRSESSRGF